MPRSRRKPRPVDFNNDEKAVLDEVARALDIDPEELSIREERGLSGFGAGTVYEIKTRGGRMEWAVVENEDQERDLALKVVKQDLDDEPEIFNQSFIESHINMERLKRDLESDMQDSNEENLRGEGDSNFWREWERAGFDAPEEDKDGDIPSPTDDEITVLAEKYTAQQLRDPMGYLEDIYGREDAVKKAIEIAGIDIDAAAEEAVDTDGAAHFLAHYDGNSHTTAAGLVYWRAN